MKKRGLVFVIMAVLMTFTACSSKQKKEPSDDTPWNHGYHAIMETEEGYYTNQVYPIRGTRTAQCLRYVEKNSKESIPLCNKPECDHVGGDKCEASYNNIEPLSTLLYDGAIYVLGVEYSGNNVAINMYRGALDGSIMDKVGCVVQADNLREEEVYTRPINSPYLLLWGVLDESFIIHRGYAYIPYFLQIGKGAKGVKGQGICRMNLSNGETEEIYQTVNLSEGIPLRVTGVGDYVYFLIAATGSSGKTKRYVISTKEVQNVVTTKENGKPGYEKPYFMFSEDRYYGLKRMEESNQLSITAYDAQTMQEVKEESFVIDDFSGDYAMDLVDAFLYDGMFVLGTRAKACFYDKQGAFLGEMDVDGIDHFSDPDEHFFLESYKICNGKLYFLYNNRSSLWGGTIDVRDDVFFSNLIWQVYACPLEDIFQGRGEWEKAYSVEGRMTNDELMYYFQMNLP
ncbi:MAG: hypothetical protein IKQ25_03770 [Lachnospiraceae bacterium]|nr:hypothetical protein [Lachnospiraceae bacterium]